MYEDIINLPHHVSDKRPQMPMPDRAAQFSPFAALTGYDDAVTETARLTDGKMELDESALATLDMKLHVLMEAIPEQPEISVTYFKNDSKKAGGAYLTLTGRLEKMDIYRRMLVFTDGEQIPFDDVFNITGNLFREMEDPLF